MRAIKKPRDAFREQPRFKALMEVAEARFAAERAARVGPTAPAPGG